MMHGMRSLRYTRRNDLDQDLFGVLICGWCVLPVLFFGRSPDIDFVTAVVDLNVTGSFHELLVGVLFSEVGAEQIVEAFGVYHVPGICV